MRILLMNPKIIYENWPIPTDFWRCFARILAATFPQIKSAVQPHHRCDVFDGIVERISMRDYVELLKKYDVIGINICAPNNALNTEITIKLIRGISENAKIILGGQHANAYCKEWIQKGADVVVRGEAEITFPKLLDALENSRFLKDIKGIAFREDGEIYLNEDREFIEDLDLLPMPSWGEFNFNNYVSPLGGNRRITAALETSRGCKFGCVFCGSSAMWKSTQRFKSAARVIEEFSYLYKKDVRNVAFADDNFGMYYERDMEIFERLIKSKMKISLWMFCRADTVLKHPDFVSAAARAGLKEVIVGYESTDDHMLSLYNKNIGNYVTYDYKKVFEIFKKNDILVLGSFVENYPSSIETKQAFSHKEICDIAMYLNFVPLKGTSGYDDLSKQGFLVSDNFYYDRLIPTFKVRKASFFKYFTKQWLGLFNSRTLESLLFPSGYKRYFVAMIYKAFFKKFFSGNLDKICDFIISINPFLAPRIKQKLIINRYLSRERINAWLRFGQRSH